MIARAQSSAPAADATFSLAVRTFWSVEPRQGLPFFDHERLTKLEVLPANHPDVSHYRNAARLFERFLAIAGDADHRTPIAHYFAGMAWFRIGAWNESLTHIEAMLQKWPGYARPRLNGKYENLRRPVQPDFLHLRFYIQLQLHPLAERLKQNEPLQVLEGVVQAAEIVLDIVAPRDAQWKRITSRPLAPVWADLEAIEPQPDQLRAAALPSVLQLVENAYNEILPGAIAKNGAKGVRAHLRELADNAHFTALAQKLLQGIDESLIKNYFAQYQRHLQNKNFDAARAVLKTIQAEYPGSAAARRAEAEFPKIVPVAVAYYKSEGEKHYQPQVRSQFGKPQTKAAEYYAKMYREAKGNEALAAQAETALLHWSKALGTTGKVPQAIGNLQQLLRDNPRSSQAAEAKFQLGFMLGSNGQRKYKDAVAWMQKVWTEHPRSPQAPDALWHAAFYELWQNRAAEGLPYLEKVLKEYPNSPRAKHAPKWIERFRQRNGMQ